MVSCGASTSSEVPALLGKFRSRYPGLRPHKKRGKEKVTETRKDLPGKDSSDLGVRQTPTTVTTPRRKGPRVLPRAKGRKEKEKEKRQGKALWGKGKGKDQKAPDQSHEVWDESWWTWESAGEDQSWTDQDWQESIQAEPEEGSFVMHPSLGSAQTSEEADALMVQGCDPDQENVEYALRNDLYLQSLVDIAQHPTYVIFDLGCTKSMGSGSAVTAFINAAEPFGLSADWHHTDTKMSCANSEKAHITWCVHLHFPTDPVVTTQVDVLDQGSVPILMLLPHMRALNFHFHLTYPACALSCEAFGFRSRKIPRSTSRHFVLDLCWLRKNIPPDAPPGQYQVFHAEDSEVQSMTDYLQEALANTIPDTDRGAHDPLPPDLGAPEPEPRVED